MISAAWLKVVKRPFASNVAIASDADSNRLRYRASDRARVSCARFSSVTSRSVATVPSSSPSTTSGVVETATTRSSPFALTIFVSYRCSSPSTARCSRSATCCRSAMATRSSIGVPGRSSSGRPNSSAAARLAVSTFRSTPVTTTASARAATISAATRAGSNTRRLSVAFGDVGGGRRHRGAERGATAHLGQIPVELLHLGDHRLGNLEALFRDVKAVSHGAPHGVVALFHADVVAEEDLAVLRRAVQQHLQPLREVADDRVEVHQEVLNLAVHQLVLRRVHNYGSVEDCLAARIQNGI